MAYLNERKILLYSDNYYFFRRWSPSKVSVGGSFLVFSMKNTVQTVAPENMQRCPKFAKCEYKNFVQFIFSIFGRIPELWLIKGSFSTYFIFIPIFSYLLTDGFFPNSNRLERRTLGTHRTKNELNGFYRTSGKMILRSHKVATCGASNSPPPPNTDSKNIPK